MSRKLLSRLVLPAARLHRVAWHGVRAASSGASAPRRAALFVTSTDDSQYGIASHTPVTLGLMNYFERHLPFMGFFQCVAAAHSPWAQDAAQNAAAEVITQGKQAHERNNPQAIGHSVVV
jgi:hypothetical protein